MSKKAKEKRGKEERREKREEERRRCLIKFEGILTEETNIICNLHQRHCDDVELTMSFNEGVVCCQSFKLKERYVGNLKRKGREDQRNIHFVGSRNEWKMSFFCNLSSDCFSPSDVGVEPLGSEILAL